MARPRKPTALPSAPAKTARPTMTPKTNAEMRGRSASTPAAQKKAAGVQSAKAFTPAVAKGKSPLDQVGSFLQSRVDLMTGKTPSPISGAMKNKTPVIPYTQKNISNIKKARGQ